MSIELAENNLWFSFLDETTSNDFRVWISTGLSGLSSKLRHFAKMWIVETGVLQIPSLSRCLGDNFHDAHQLYGATLSNENTVLLLLLHKSTKSVYVVQSCLM